MEMWQIIVVVLAAVAVGFLVPALVQMRRTLRSAELFLESTRPRLVRTLDDLSATSARLNELSATLEQNLGRVRPALGGVSDDLVRTVENFRGSLRLVSSIGAALGPAIAAWIGALMARRRGGEEAAGPAPETGRGQPAPREVAHE